jgi:glucose-6-phosphate 1-dehydrogenase
MDDVVLQAQYGKGIIGKEHVPAYRAEKGIDKDSRTNTFVAMKLVTRISRWEGVPFYLRSGKRMSKKETRVSILFQEPRQVGKGATPNRLDIILQGEAGMRVHLQTKVGGTEPSFRPLILEDPLVCFGDCLPEHALLILEAVHGKRQWFLSFEEVRTAWRLCDPVQAYLDSKTAPLHTYPAGSNGPEEADTWIAKDGRKWC